MKGKRWDIAARVAEVYAEVEKLDSSGLLTRAQYDRLKLKVIEITDGGRWDHLAGFAEYEPVDG